ncbi:MAG: TetR/AcrR family transcriptional regulator [Alphaproteobacteria bacterium]|nr:TetR/AcrR family transcriptional regulator [Alphaproteobacteria bacterium]
MTTQTTHCSKPSARTRILKLAETAIIQKGFAGTSIDELVAGAGITKSGFFYHFRDKSELAIALLERHFEQDDEILDSVFARARELTDDPLQMYLTGLKLLAEVVADLRENHPGCLVASICYQDQLFNREVRELNQRGTLTWRTRFGGYLREVAAKHPPKIDVDLDELADMISTLVEGGIVLVKVLKEPKLLSRQILLYRSFVRAVFAGV